MKRKHLYLLICGIAVLIWSAYHPKEYFTWFLEVFPGAAGMIILAFTYRQFKFSTFVYLLIFIHCCILFAGGKYTYAENPLFEYLKNILHLERNNYDKLGHLFQGLVPTLIVREIFIRKQVIKGNGWIFFLSMTVAMFISAVYELIEWATSLLSGESGDAFLGTQGYIWDTQSDMFFALIGSLVSLLILSRYHDKSMNRQ